MSEITVKELKARMDKGENVVLLDVREPYEHELGNIGGANIPMGTLPSQLEDLEELKEQEVIVYCRSGGRSGAMCSFLRQAGFNKVLNLTGGMLAWQDEVDPSLKVD